MHIKAVRCALLSGRQPSDFLAFEAKNPLDNAELEIALKTRSPNLDDKQFMLFKSEVVAEEDIWGTIWHA